MKPGPLLDEVAGAILDGAPIDWDAVDSPTGETDHALVEQLKTLAALRLVSRHAAPPSAEEKYWGHLRVLDRIGTGAFGDVYRAWDTRLDREVALKLLPPEPPGLQSSGSSIIEEGRLLARVRHPNVVTIYGAERVDNRIGLWMELVNGRTLEQALGDGRTFTAKDVARIGVDLCRALSAVHAAGLFHRDVKTQNVMMADDGRLVLMDFGTGLESEGSSNADTSGTPLYLAPEVLAGSPASVRSEVYSIGVVLYHLLTRSYPVQGRDLADLRRAHRAREHAALPADTAIPPRLRRVIARAIAPAPDRRYSSTDAFAEALVAAERVPVPVRAARYVAAAIAVVVVAALAWSYGLRDLVTAKPAATPVIVVLPFQNLSPEPDSDYFVDGLTSEVIRNLAVIDGVQVRSQTSSFFFKDKPRDLRAIGDRLGANLVVEADVMRVGNRLRINAQLVRIDGDVPLWSERFDRTLNDVFAIQDEISLAIVNRLRLTLGTGQRRYQTNLQAYEVYLRARAVRPGLGEGRGPEQAIKLFEQVIAMDPAFAPAYAGLVGTIHLMSWNLGGGTTWAESMRPAAVKALELDPLLAEAHVAMGLLHTNDRDFESATKSFERALELNPNLTQIHTGYSDALVLMGQKERALWLLEQAAIMDPLSLHVRRDLAFAQFLNGRYEDAVANARRVVATDPDFMSHLPFARELMFAGRPEEAIAVWKSRPTNRTWELWLVRAYLQTGQTREAERVLAANRNERPYRQAIMYAALGDKDRTFAALERAAETEANLVAAILFAPEMEFLLGDPRRDDLKRKLKLP